MREAVVISRSFDLSVQLRDGALIISEQKGSLTTSDSNVLFQAKGKKKHEWQKLVTLNFFDGK